MIYLCNAFSIQMLASFDHAQVNLDAITREEFLDMLKGGEWQSAIGHADTAAVLSDMFWLDIPANRVDVKLTDKDTLLVCQLIGGRLPEGSKELPTGFTFKLFKVRVDYHNEL